MYISGGKRADAQKAKLKTSCAYEDARTNTWIARPIPQKLIHRIEYGQNAIFHTISRRPACMCKIPNLTLDSQSVTHTEIRGVAHPCHTYLCTTINIHRNGSTRSITHTHTHIRISPHVLVVHGWAMADKIVKPVPPHTHTSKRRNLHRAENDDDDDGGAVAASTRSAHFPHVSVLSVFVSV